MVKRVCGWLAVALACCPPPTAAAEIVRAEIGKAVAWVGEPVPLLVTLYSPGPFSGTASFDLPRLPQTVIVKAGNPVVGSQDVAGESYFTQRHEFTLYCQRAGEIVIPRFPVRFAGKSSFLSDPEARDGMTEELRFQSRRPPGTEHLGVVVSVTRMEATQTWTPPAQSVAAGDVIERTITRSATGTSAMMLTPASAMAPAGVRQYVADPIVEDHVERGSARAERRDRIKYQFEQPGTFDLPDVSLVWWDPQAEQLQRLTLPGASISVRVASESAAAATIPSSEALPAMGLLVVLAIAAAVWLLFRPAQRIWIAWYARRTDPEALSARRLRSACRADDASAAYRAFVQWLRCVPANGPGRGFDGLPWTAHTADLRNAWSELSRQLFAVDRSTAQWSGQQLARALVRVRRELKRAHRSRRESSALPPLNPTVCARERVPLPRK